MSHFVQDVNALLANVGCICVLSLPIVFINYFGYPYIRGFDPTDPANALPEKKDTVPIWLAVVTTLLLVVIPIVALEIIVKIYLKQQFFPDSLDGSISAYLPIPRCPWPVVLGIFRLLGVAATGLCLTTTSTESIKYMISRTRPSFLHMCLPNYSNSTYAPCKPCGSKANPGIFWPMCPTCPYIPPEEANKICEQNDHWIATDMWLSFPSGHTAFCFFGALFTSIYIYRRLSFFPAITFSFIAFRPFAIALSFAFPVYVALTRISDNRHHLTDVLSGAAIGTIYGIFFIMYIAFPSLQHLPHFQELPNFSHHSYRILAEPPTLMNVN